MRLSILHRTTAATLLGIFFLFIVGIPVVQSLCPMMGMNDGVCPMHEQGCNREVSLTSQFGDCCSAKMVAERNTTPFVKFEEKKSISFQVLSPISNTSILLESTKQQTSFAILALDTSPPLFLLHSSLLI